MKASHLNTQKINKWIEFTITKQFKHVLYRNIITNLPNRDNSK